jgi:hypothetical protein
MILHAHIDSAARDCDGLYTRDYVMTMTDAERLVAGGDEYAFEGRVLHHVVSLYGYGGTLTVTRGDIDNGEDWTRLSWSEPTEEGYRNIEATFCRDDCDLDEHSQRDHTAEAAGY